MAQIVKATLEEKPELIEFINYVFTEAHEPHNFKTLLPKVYADSIKGLGAEHYLVKEKGSIKATVSDRRITMDVLGEKLKFGIIGNVSTHPDCRGAGYMKELIPFAIDEAKNSGVDLMILGGQRQRYGYFGFEPAGFYLSYTVSSSNIRHCLNDAKTEEIEFTPLDYASDKEICELIALYNKRAAHTAREKTDFFETMNSWAMTTSVIREKGNVLGYVYGGIAELVLKNEKDFGRVIAAFIKSRNLSKVKVPTAPFETERNRYLESICEGVSVEQIEMVKVLDYKKVLSAYLKLKASYIELEDIDKTLNVEGKAYNITVKNGVPSVNETDDKANPLTETEAERLIFGMNGLVNDNGWKNIFPLPFIIDTADTF